MQIDEKTTKYLEITLLIGLICMALVYTSVPYTTSQFIDQTTDLNFAWFDAGIYEGNYLIIDGNKISSTSVLTTLSSSGEIYIEQEDTPIILTFPAADADVNVTGWEMGHTRGFTAITDGLIVEKAGTYKCDLSISFSGGVGGAYGGNLGIGGIRDEHCYLIRKLGTGGDVGNAGFTCINDFNAGDVLTILMHSKDDPTKDAYIHVANFNCVDV